MIALMLTCIAAFADSPPSESLPSADSNRTHIVNGVGAFQSKVHPSIVTVLYFPGPVTSAISSDDQSFETSIVGHSVVIRPAPNVTAKTVGNINITTRAMNVSLTMRIAERPEDAATQLVFRALSEVEAFETRVAAEVERVRQEVEHEYERRHRNLEREVTHATEQAIARRMLMRHEGREFGAIARNEHNIIARVTRAQWIGPELYLYFEIQNRDSTPYHLAHVRLLGPTGESDHVDHLEFAGAGDVIDGSLGTVLSGQRGRGIVHVRDAARFAGKPFTFLVSEARERRAVSIGGITW
ncbi:DUF2381 family protein [Haliangium ochraceum]|uniref:DUF2381 family protein n=1 Tax=Haliangium ochraceum TaxID=80816 RepID=UPI0018F02399|nr:DUF2381 family protein [Haliangium ochraceum]